MERIRPHVKVGPSHDAAPLSPLVPSPLAGEGTMVCLRTRMGEGWLPQYPSPTVTRGNIEPPSPARGEGATMPTAFGALFTFQTAQIYSFPRRVFAPGFCNFASPTRIEGWAERRETFGCSAEHPLGLHMTRQARRLRGALRPMTRDARLSALHRGGFGLPGPRFSHRHLRRIGYSELLAPRS